MVHCGSPANIVLQWSNWLMTNMLIILGVICLPSMRRIGSVDAGGSSIAYTSHLKLRIVRRLLTFAAFKTLIHAFVMHQVEYCNTRCVWQCTAARLVLGQRKIDNISTDIRTHLYWVHLCKRVYLRHGTLIFKCVHYTAPAPLHYKLSDHCRPDSCVNCPGSPIYSFVQQQMEICLFQFYKQLRLTQVVSPYSVPQSWTIYIK